MTLNNFSTTARDGMVDLLVDLIDVGTGVAQGYVEIGTDGGNSTFGDLLASLDFSNPAFDSAGAAGGNADGVATANPITEDTNATATGTAARFRVKDRDAAVVWEGTVGAGSGDIALSSVSIEAGDTVSISSWTVTAP